MRHVSLPLPISPKVTLNAPLTSNLLLEAYSEYTPHNAQTDCDLGDSNSL